LHSRDTYLGEAGELGGALEALLAALRAVHRHAQHHPVHLCPQRGGGQGSCSGSAAVSAGGGGRGGRSGEVSGGLYRAAVDDVGLLDGSPGEVILRAVLQVAQNKADELLHGDGLAGELGRGALCRVRQNSGLVKALEGGSVHPGTVRGGVAILRGADLRLWVQDQRFKVADNVIQGSMTIVSDFVTLEGFVELNQRGRDFGR